MGCEITVVLPESVVSALKSSGDVLSLFIADPQFAVTQLPSKEEDFVDGYTMKFSIDRVSGGASESWEK